MTAAITLHNLVAYVLQSSALIAAALTALWVFRIDAANVRYFVLRLTLVAVLVLPFVQPRVSAPLESLALPTVATSDTGHSERVVAPPPRGFNFEAAAFGGPSAATVGTVLVAGMLVRLLWLALGVWRLQLLRRIGETAVGDEYVDLQQTIGTHAELRYVSGLGQPLTFGFRVPLVLLPESLRGLPENLRRAVVAHELWHVRRRDWLSMIVEESLRAAFWFHPAMWVLLSRIQVAREETIDELAVLTTGSRRAYLDALLAFADAHPLFATTAFARRRHLLHRMLMISKESVMSSQRLVASFAAVLVLVAATAFTAAATFPLSAQQSPPRDPPPPPPPPGSNHQMVFVPATEAELQRAIEKDPKNAGLYGALARYYVREGQFERAVATLEALALADPASPQHHQMLAVFYWEKAFRDATLSGEQKTTYLLAGIAAADRALAMDPDYPEALIYKNILLRTLATYTADVNEQRRLVQEADTLRARALELSKARGIVPGSAPAETGGMPPPPPPPPPPFGKVDGFMPVRVGGNIPPPTKINDVKPIYPPAALESRLSGSVVIETVIDVDGRVRDARVLRSIPLFDQAALDAVKGWVFTPTVLNNVAVPVIMTVTINFRPD